MIGCGAQVGLHQGMILIRKAKWSSNEEMLEFLCQLRVEIEAGLIETSPPPSEVSRTIGITTRRDWRPTAAQRSMQLVLRELAQDYS